MRVCVYCFYHNNDTQHNNNNSQRNSNNNKKNKNKACYASLANKMGPKFMFVLAAGLAAPAAPPLLLVSFLFS